ncbi:MAG: hypothetical protein E6H66_19415 [Betaproteobacteria bacterium]|nr:MAG: hypothetical protein E6H66_19415 [Betaproteobacteria bacterium]
MSIVTRWTMLLAASGGAAFPALLRSKRYKEKRAHTAALHQWENEGGNLAPAPEASDALVTAGSA